MNAQLVLEQLSQQESRRIFATLLRLLGDFDRAEEALQEAFRIALEKWPLQGVPKNPVSWLISAGRFRAIDQLRRQSRQQPFDMDIAVEDELEEFADDRLRLVKGGKILAAEPLHPIHTATTVRVRQGKAYFTDGPFAETKELLAGFYLLEATNLDEALELAAQIPPAQYGSIEVRPVRELERSPQ